MRVLHVEDNPTDADLTRRILNRQAPDIGLEWVDTRAGAMARLQMPAGLDLALVDLRLPDGSGLELLAWIREQRIPIGVVVLTGSGDQEAAIAALRAGADDYLTKDARALDRLPGILRDAWRRFREAQARSARSLQVLYAEHNQADIDLTRRHLSRHAPHIRLTAVADVREVLARLPADPLDPSELDLVLLDYRLPGLDALEAVKILRVERGLDIPIVMVSGQGSEEVAARAIHLGANDYLTKHAGYLHQLPATLENAWGQVALARERAQLRAISDRLGVALASSPAVLYTRRLGPDERPLTWISENLVHLLGYSPAEALEPDWWPSHLHADDREAALAWLSSLDLGGCMSHEYRLLDGRGRMCWIRDELAFSVAESGAIPQATGVWRDITESKLAEQMRETRLAVLDALIDNRSLGGILKEIGCRLEAVCPDMQVSIRTLPEGPLAPAHPPPPEGPADWIVPFQDGAGEALGHFHVRFLAPGAPTPAERDLIGEFARIAGLAAARVRADARLRQAATLFESAREGVLITDLDGRILTVNRAFAEITGYSEAEVQGLNPRLLRSGRHDADFYSAMWTAIGTRGHWDGEIWNRRKSGELFPSILSIGAVYDGERQPTHYVGVMTDISQLKQSEARLEHLVLYDPLTHLPNRRLVLSRLQHALEHADRQGHRVAVLFIDLDRFKNVNDSLGHPVGDELLEAIADRLSRRLREEDTLARLGGDEFLLLIEAPSRPEDAAVVAQIVLGQLERPFRLSGGHELYVGASIGISLYPDDGGSVTDLVKHADVAMYQAKEEGRSTYRFYTPALTRVAQERLALEAHLRRALTNGELILHYQPQIEIQGSRFIGCEALVRWRSPQEGLISPMRFIPLAEETGLIVPIGEWVLTTACAQGKAWLDAGMSDLTMAVNLSGRQLNRPDLVLRVAAILEETGLPPGRLKLELTESTIMGQGDRAAELLQALKSLGLRLSVDDFGTGYSSLAHLKHFPIDELKIDRGFVRDIPEDQNDREIAATIIAMARNLNLKVIAEGVETLEQLDFLSRHGCYACQGYLFGRPVASDVFEQAFVLPGRGSSLSLDPC